MANSFLDDLGRDYLNQDWQAAFSWLFGPQLQKNNPYASFLKGKSGDYQNLYRGKVADNPNLTFLDYLQGQNPMQDWQNLAPSQRGERGPAPVRFLNLFGGR